MDSNVSVHTTTVITNFQSTTSFNGNHIKFGVLLVLQLISAPCFLWIFYQFGRQRSIRQSYHNHIILLLLVVSFLFVPIALPLTQAYMFTSYVYSSTKTFCSLWTWIHYSLNIINLFLMAFASIERNWLVFHPWLVRSKRGKVLFHYCPLTFCLIYPSIFYFGMIFIYQCEFHYYYTQLLCTYPCYFNDPNWGNINLYLNNYTPLFAIPVFCSIIYVRVLIQKRAMKQQAFQWNRDKKMLLQLWARSSLYLGMLRVMSCHSYTSNQYLPRYISTILDHGR